ncbi:MAG: IPT/TIG domain-containing protein [Actinomycetota bacterium]
MRRVIRAFLILATLLVIGFSQLGSYASSAPCVDVNCRDVTGTVTDPHANPIAGITVWLKTTNGYTETGVTDAAGHYAVHMPIPSTVTCPIAGTFADEFYAGDAYRGKLCDDATLDFHPKYRVRATAPSREIFFPDYSKAATIHLVLYANSHSYPAPFAKDPLSWTLTNHTVSSGTKALAAQGIFTAPTATKVATGVWSYVWQADLTSKVSSPTMVHVDWGNGTNFAQMMDCRMLFIGEGITSISPATAVPGQLVTIKGQSFGTTAGHIQLNGYGYQGGIDPTSIISWTTTEIQFLLPADAKNTWIRVFTNSGANAWCLGGGTGAPTQKVPLKVLGS